MKNSRIWYFDTIDFGPASRRETRILNSMSGRAKYPPVKEIRLDRPDHWKRPAEKHNRSGKEILV